MKRKILQIGALMLFAFVSVVALTAQNSAQAIDEAALEELMSGIRLTPLTGEMIAPDFGLKELSGREVRLSDFRGKLVLLNFFATWCASCIWEMPEMETLYRAYKDKGFTVLAVSLDFWGPDKVKKFAEKNGLTFPIVMDTDKEVAREYGLKGPPLTYLIDPDGRMVAGVRGPTSWADPAAFRIVEHYLSMDGVSSR